MLDLLSHSSSPISEKNKRSSPSVRLLQLATALPPGCHSSISRTRGARVAAPRPEEVVDGETVVLAGHDEQEEKQSQTRNDVLVERIQRLLDEMSERHDDEHSSEGQQRLANSPAHEKSRAGEQLHEGNRETGGPERPDGQERVLVRQKPPPD